MRDRSSTRLVGVLFGSFLALSAVAGATTGSSSRPLPVPKSPDQLTNAAAQPLVPKFGSLPLDFEANYGQADPSVRFLSAGRGYRVMLTDTEAIYVMSKRDPAPEDRTAECPSIDGRDRLHRGDANDGQVSYNLVRSKLVGANETPLVDGTDQLVGKSNYFIGNDPTKWHTDIPHFGKVRYQGVYPGIDLVYYGNEGRLEYDFVVHPGADPSVIRIAWEGADGIRTDSATGDLVVKTAMGEIRQHKPLVYQEIDGRRVEIASAFVVGADRHVGVCLASFDRDRTLVVDPVVTYATFFDGTDRIWIRAVAVDATGIYLGGSTTATDHPIVGGYQTTSNGTEDAFLTKFNPGGTAILFSTYLGGSNSDRFLDIGIDGSGNVVAVGTSGSSNYPVVSQVQGHLGSSGSYNGVVTRFNSSGNALTYSTYFGDDTDGVTSVFTDSAGTAWITGDDFGDTGNYHTTSGVLFPTPASISCGNQPIWVAKMNPGGSVAFSTYVMCGSDRPILTVDSAGSIFVASEYDWGDDVFPTNGFDPDANGNSFGATLVKMNSTGSQRLAGTYFGSYVNVNGLVASGGKLYFSGEVYGGGNVPVANAFDATYAGGDAFLAALDGSQLHTLSFSTYFGGSGGDEADSLVEDAAGLLVMAGTTGSNDMPTLYPFQASLSGGSFTDAFVSKWTPAGQLLFSSYLGGTTYDSCSDISVDSAGRMYLVGAPSPNFPATAGAYDTTSNSIEDGFLAILGYTLPAPTVTLVNPASGPVAGGTSVTITGTNFVSGASVYFGGVAATGVGYVDAQTLTATTPTHSLGPVDVMVLNPDSQYGILSAGYYYLGGLPTITTIAPAFGSVLGGTTVYLTGTNFAVSGVTFDGFPATAVTQLSPTQVRCVTPAHAVGAVDVVLTNIDLQSGTKVGGYTYLTDVRGDANSDFNLTSSDIVYLVNYLFRSGPAPAYLCRGDANSDGVVTATDIIFLVNYLYVSGAAAPAPCP